MANKTNKNGNNNNNDNSVSVGLDFDTSGFDQAERYFHRAQAFIKSFSTSMENMFIVVNKSLNLDSKEMFGSISGRNVDGSADVGVSNEAINQSKRATEQLEKTNKKMVESNKKVAESFELIDYAAVSVFRRILKTTVGIYGKLTIAGSNMTETNSRFNYVLGELASQAESYAEIIANAYAITETAAKTAITKVYQLATSSGIASKNALEMAKGVAILGAELSSVWDVPTEQAVNALISAMQGLPKAGKNLSLYLNVSEIKTVLQEAGIAISGTLTQQQKVLGAFLKSLKDAGYAIGDFGRTQTSVANQLRLINTAITSISENLGITLNTILSPLLQVVNFFLKNLVRITNMLNDMPEPIKMVIGLFATFSIAIPVVVSLFVLLTRVKQIYKRQVESLITTLVKQNSVIGRTAKIVTERVLPSFITLTKTVLPLAMFIGFTVGFIQKLGEASNKTSEGIDNITKAAENSQKALAGYDDVNTLSFDTTSGGLNESYWEQIEEQLIGTNETITEVGNNILWLYGIMAVGSGVASVVNIIKSWSSITKVFKTLKLVSADFLMAFQLSLESLSTQISLTMIGAVALTAAFYAILSVLVQDWESPAARIVAAIGAITAAIGSLVFIIGVLKKNAIMATIGAAVAIGGFTATGIAFASDEQATIIPKLATGGTTIGPTKALVGEGRYREAIIPLGNSAEFASMKNDITNAVVAGLTSAGGSNGNINININVDEDYIYKAYNRQKALREGTV